jgi:hypothetical protein
MSHALLFYNGTDARVSVAVAYGGGEDGSCPDTSGSDLITRGWWNIDPQQTIQAFEIGNAVVDRGYVWFYAEGGGREWSGNDLVNVLPSVRFYDCHAGSVDTGRTTGGSETHGFTQVHFGGASRHTVRLNP